MVTSSRWKAPDMSLVARGDPMALETIKSYLRRFGHLEDAHGDDHKDVKAALKNFQDHVKLTPTGEYDQATAAHMGIPRCGMGVALRAVSTNDQRAAGATRLAPGPSKPWPYCQLMYKFLKFTPKMSESEIRSCLNDVFLQWGRAAGQPLSFTDLTDRPGTTADIKLDWDGGQTFDGPGGVLATTWWPTDGRTTFDMAEDWNRSFLTAVALHEIGHNLGLEHSSNPDDVMYEFYNGRQQLALEDKLRIGSIYGLYDVAAWGNEGLGGCDLKSSNDRAFAFDMHQSGRSETIFFYRPGERKCWVVGREANGTWQTYYATKEGDSGIGGFDLDSTADQAFAFDYDGSGLLDHICLYRPGKGAFFIVGRDRDGKWLAKYSQGQGGNGIGTFDLTDSADRAFALDYTGTGKMDHICLYRPGRGAIFIIRRKSATEWVPVYKQVPGGDGIGGYDLADRADRAFAFDYHGSGRMDHICLYRPGRGACFIVGQEGNNVWKARYSQGQGGTGIGNYDLSSPRDQIIPLSKNQLFLYRPGNGAAYVVDRYGSGPTFGAIYKQGDGGSGICGWDFRNTNDQAFAMTLDNSSTPDQLVLYRPGEGKIRIYKKRSYKLRP